VLVALEVISQVIRRPSVTEWYFLLSWIIVIFYSSGQTDRYLLPAYPLFCIYLVESVHRLGRHRRRFALASLYAVLTLGVAFNVRATQTGPYAEGVAKTSFLDTCEFLRNNTGRGSRIMFWNPRVLAL